ncbi:SDR family oxidoreductase, partial [Halarchaeum acidiphilum]
MTLEDFDEGYRGVLRSTVVACREALPVLAENGSAVTNLVAASALEPSASGVLGNVFRLGIYGLSKVLAEEYGDEGVRVNCVAPRGIISDRIEQKIAALAEGKGIDEADARQKRIDELPLNDLGTPDEFARMVTYVSSPAAGYLTGAVSLSTVAGTDTRSNHHFEDERSSIRSTI